MAIKDNSLAYAVLGCAMKVHRTLGCGFLEAVYADALEIELTDAEIPFEREKEIRVSYNGQILKSAYRADFVCGNGLIVELKAIKTLTNIEKAQVLNYVKATGALAALLINFAQPSLQYEYLTPRIWEEEGKETPIQPILLTNVAPNEKEKHSKKSKALAAQKLI